jgi:hypothetical protein
VRRIVKVFVVAVLVATVLVISSTVAFTRPLRGGVPLQNKQMCDKLAGNHPRFETTAPRAPEDPSEDVSAACWHVSPGLERASDVPPSK